MKQYKVKAYNKGLLRMSQIVMGKKMAEAVKRIYVYEYGFSTKDVDIVRI